MTELISKAAVESTGVIIHGTFFTYIAHVMAKYVIIRDLGDMYEVERVQ